MTQAEWLACADPLRMQEFLRGRGSERRWRLLSCACCRRVWHLLADERSRQGVEATERFADGFLSREELRRAGSAAYQAWWETEPRDDDDEDHPRYDPHHGQALFCAANAVVRLTGTGEHAGSEGVASEVRRAVWFASEDQRAAEEDERKAQCALVRDLFDDPFHPLALDSAWRTPDVLSLARAAYQERILPSGVLERARLALLADALEDAGCTDEVILAHLRGEGPHVRGCWALDLVTGKQ
jgi:hypothetical protein